jgi:bifunctional non-homologous end joining protein LigD
VPEARRRAGGTPTVATDEAADAPAAQGALAALAEYHRKRDFSATPEPPSQAPPAVAPTGAPVFVVQKHSARSLHYDFRLQADGVLWSWAVPKGPSDDPAVKRLAVRTEDHPLAYAGFAGRIPEGHYGAGLVELWDRGWWRPLGDAAAGPRDGHLRFELHGQRLQGVWDLVLTGREQAAGARRAAKPAAWLLFRRAEQPLLKMAPQLATAVPPTESTWAMLTPERWLLETKYDGYRLMAHLHHGRVRLITRNGHDWTGRLPTVAAALAGLPAGTAWLDGELVVRDAAGRTDFHRLQQAIEGSAAALPAFEYWLFDLPHFDGHDLRDRPLADRRELLRQLLDHGPGAPVLGFSPEWPGPAALAFARACRDGVEGLIAKRRDAPYRSGRSSSWLKLKCRRHAVLVVGGYTVRQGSRGEVGSLLLGQPDAAGRLKPVGRVGTGWNAATARELLARLRPLARATAPFDAPLAGRRRAAGPEAEVHWVRPQHRVEVAFSEWTPGGQLRHATYLGGPSDPPAEASYPRQGAPAQALRPRRGTQTITHGERIVDARSGATKADLVAYFDAAAPWLLDELKDRPVALLRAPEGVAGEHFFQKHLTGTTLPEVTRLPPSLWPGHAPLLQIDNRRALLAAAQMNVLELHTSPARSAAFEMPDRVVFDLDPGEGVAFAAVCEAALGVRAALQALGLRSWLKTSGGKGLHVVVPVRPQLAHPAVKAFARQLAEHLARTVPSRFVARSGPANRVGRIFIDYLRNSLAATTVAAYSPRARPGLGVSMPVQWDEIEGERPALRASAQWTVADAARHLASRRVDPWAGLRRSRQSLLPAVERLR